MTSPGQSWGPDGEVERQKGLLPEGRPSVFKDFLVVVVVTVVAGGLAFLLLRPDSPTESGRRVPYVASDTYTESSSTYAEEPVSSDGGFRDTGGDTSVIDTLAAAGVTEESALAVARLGDLHGFILDTRSPTYEESINFAYMSVLECQSVANGETTWAQVRSESISTGATPSEAGAMTSYWEDTFCPGLDLDAL